MTGVACTDSRRLGDHYRRDQGAVASMRATPRTRPWSPGCSPICSSAGLDTSGGTLVVVDGAKSLTKAVRKMFGGQAPIQRCTVHKRRKRELVEHNLVCAFGHPDPELGASQIGPTRRSRPASARGSRNVHRPPAQAVRQPRATLTMTNPVESERDLHRANYPAQRQALEGRGDAPALDRRRNARR